MGEWFTEATFRTPFPLICLDVSSTFYLSLGIYYSFCVSFFIAIGCKFFSTHAKCVNKFYSFVRKVGGWVGGWLCTAPPPPLCPFDKENKRSKLTSLNVGSRWHIVIFWPMIGPGGRCWAYKERKIKEGEAQLNE